MAWFDATARDLPWRRTNDPYRIWVAEVLLQQTRIEQAIPYYERFLRAFPTLSSLAKARRERVMKVWEGAGYYSRAHRLHDASREIFRDHGGRLPTTPEELEQLPGFGPYTSRSVAALAFGHPKVALDANGLRVISRLFLLDLPPAERGRAASEVAERALGDLPPRAFNEGLMELGQRYCAARSPRCPECPLRDLCRARAELPDPGVFPPAAARPPRPRVVAAVGVLVGPDGRVLISRRPKGGLLGGLWEFPGGKVEPGETPAQTVVREFEEEVGVRARVVRHLGTLEHDYSHFHVTLHGFLLAATTVRAVPLSPSRRWTSPRKMGDLPLPTATRRMLPWLADVGGGEPPKLAPVASRSSGPPRIRTGP